MVVAGRVWGDVDGVGAFPGCGGVGNDEVVGVVGRAVRGSARLCCRRHVAADLGDGALGGSSEHDPAAQFYINTPGHNIDIDSVSVRAAAAWRTVDRVQPEFEWTGVSNQLWLRRIVRTASPGTAAAVVMPEVLFHSKNSLLDNRADGLTILMYRVDEITDELGGANRRCVWSEDDDMHDAGRRLVREYAPLLPAVCGEHLWWRVRGVQQVFGDVGDGERHRRGRPRYCAHLFL